MSISTSIQDNIRTFVIQNFLFGDGSSLQDQESFLEAGIIDSTGVLELVGFLESTFGIAVRDEDLVPANLDSVDRASRFVERKLNDEEGRLAG
jgi:acyl carrier protein